MGCVSCKFVTRSNSFHEELRQNLQGRVNRLPIFEDLPLSKNGGDQFLSLVCAANTVTPKLHTVVSIPVFDVDKTPITEQDNVEIINTWELMAGLDEREDDDEREAEREEETINSSSPPEILTTSRSFHVVQGAEGEASKLVSMESSISVTELPEASKRSKPLAPSRSSCAMELRNIYLAMPPRSAATCEVNNNLSVGDVTMEEFSRKEDLTDEKGSRRRARAKELGKLNIPVETFDFPSSGSLKDWINGVCTYATPKFGSASNSGELVTVNRNDSGESTLFDPDILAAFEEAMQKLSAEEELVLKQIVDRWEEEGHAEILDSEQG